jgi:tetratricopeptide (TPR) repeat protein
LLERVLTSRFDTDGLARLHAAELEAPMIRPEDYVRRSARLLEIQRNEEALAVAKRGSEIAPSYAELRFNAAMAALRLGDERFALDELTRVDDSSATVFPDASKIRAALMIKLGDTPGAVRALRDWLVGEDHGVDAVIEGSRILAAGAARDEARSLLKEFADDDQRIALELAKLLLEEGDLQAAGAVAERALR